METDTEKYKGKCKADNGQGSDRGKVRCLDYVLRKSLLEKTFVFTPEWGGGGKKKEKIAMRRAKVKYLGELEEGGQKIKTSNFKINKY